MTIFFGYDPELGFETFKTADEAKAWAENALECYRENAIEDGWSEEVDQVCWGELCESAFEIPAGKMMHEGEEVDAVDYRLMPPTTREGV